MNANRLIALLALMVWLLPLAAYAQTSAPQPAAPRRTAKTTGPVDITARELRYNKEQNIYTAEGDVEMKQGTKRLNADFVLYNQTTEDAFADGHVMFEDQSDTIYAERMSINLATQKGTIENGRVFTRMGNFYMTGKEIEKTGEASYMVHNGQFTTCGWDRPSWTFTAKEVELTLGEYATAHSTVFSILGHNVLYIPWSMFPVKTERQSGFLLPRFQLSSRDGPIIRTAYYWAIAKDKDATFFADWIEQRGFKPGAEYRYATSETTKGSWYASIIHDNKYDGDRYQIKGEHQQMFGDMTFKTNINHVSDNLYLQDLGITTLERMESSLRSVAFVEKPLPRSLLTVDAEYFQTLTQKDNSGTTQYLPSASYFTEYLPMFKNRIYGDVSADLTNFWRPVGERATRLTATPSVHVPYSWEGLNFLGTASLIEKAYSVLPTSPDPNRMIHQEAISLQGDANMKFMKETSTDFLKLGDMQSVIMPRLQYNYLQNTQSPYRFPSMDFQDRVFNANSITYSLNHYLNGIGSDGNVRELSLFEVGQTFGLVQSLPGNPFLYQGSGDRLSEIHSRLTLFPSKNFWYVTDEYFDVSGKGLQNIVNSVHFATPPRFQIDLSHSYSPGLTTGQGVDQVWLATVTRWRYIDVSYQIRYDYIQHRWLDTLGAITYHPGCWSVTFTVIETRIPRDTSFHLSFNLQGITQRTGGY